VLTDTRNVYQYLIKVHQQFNSYKESNQRSRIKKIPFLLPCTSQFKENEFLVQNYEETVYETEVNGYNILYQFEYANKLGRQISRYATILGPP
jgi:hypothetical protein